VAVVPPPVALGVVALPGVVERDLLWPIVEDLGAVVSVDSIPGALAPAPIVVPASTPLELGVAVDPRFESVVAPPLTD
jgi:hypothetical protein